MIISRGRKYIFVHIPKTGGTALALALEARAMKDDILLGDTPKAKNRRKRQQALKANGRLWKHARLADIDGIVSPAEIKQFFVCTLVRNPWDRVVSYFYWLQGQSFDHPAVALARKLPFAAFLNHPQIMASIQNSSFGSYVTDRDGKQKCDCFIRLEHLEQDLAPLWRHLGFTLSDIAPVNTSQRQADYREYYSSRDAELLSELCAEDIGRFGYRF